MSEVAVPEWVYVEFGDWMVIYHHGGLVGVGANSYAVAQRGWYLDAVANDERAAFTGSGRGALHIALMAGGEDGDDWPDAWNPFADSGAPATIEMATIAALQASAGGDGATGLTGRQA